MACRWIDGIKTRERRNEGKEEERTVARHVFGPQNKSDDNPAAILFPLPLISHPAAWKLATSFSRMYELYLVLLVLYHGYHVSVVHCFWFDF
jgi:hypothetical protein